MSMSFRALTYTGSEYFVWGQSLPVTLCQWLVYRARPILSLAGSWGQGVGKAREGLADVISIHELSGTYHTH